LAAPQKNLRKDKNMKKFLEKYKRAQEKMFHTLETTDTPTKLTKFINLFILALIVINTVLIVVETFNIPEYMFVILGWVELVSVIIFSGEYLLRLWIAPLHRPKMNPWLARLRWMITPMAIIDLLAVLPFFIPASGVDLRVLRGLRLLRIFRLFKIGRYSDSINAIARVVKNKASQLLSAVFVLGIFMVIISVVMYSVETEAQPGVFANAFDAWWWAINTLSTVGYGDVYPITVIGRILNGVISLLGIGLIAIPTGIISAGFIENARERREAKLKEELRARAESNCCCPSCGGDIKFSVSNLEDEKDTNLIPKIE